jgi:hypothetical protein
MNMHVIPGKKRKLSRGVCAYCDRRVFPANSPEAKANKACQATRDHIEPQLLGTVRDRNENLVIACFECNSIKGHYPLEPFMFFLAAYRGTPKYNMLEFRRFVYDLTLAGFKAARVVALAHRAKPPRKRDERGRFMRRAA